MRPLSRLLHLDLVRSGKAVQHLTTFVVAAVSTILITRLYLALTGYPQIGGDTGLHIAHVLPGGLLMLIALGISLSYLGPGPRPLVALLGGVGFGLFIDEVGKFVTSDNDYFFQPSAAIMYVIFTAVVVGANWWRRRRPLTERERVAEAAHVLIDGLAGRLPERRRREILHSLDQAEDCEGAAELRNLLEGVTTRPPSVPARLEHLWHRVGDAFEHVTSSRFALPVMGALLLVQTAGAALALLSLWDSANPHGLVIAGVLLGAGASLVFTLIGFRQGRRRGRRAAVEFFQRSVLTSLLVTQVFLFAASQFAATAGLVADLVLLGLINVDLARIRAGRAV
ncbi:hypothetical protein FHR75_004015 [Kineococcus radiotolerans]|uniref:Uncharacterized protein n=1 Tax=Kineococcus radiotolerans TaxID=131568 RepID=A0A7W4TQD6_KINRA|nr:hypothetical protein [Kineococcus radiotolerans]MBB2903173.1 hypothetical protein [Kineococcus radiotolerans]